MDIPATEIDDSVIAPVELALNAPDPAGIILVRLAKPKDGLACANTADPDAVLGASVIAPDAVLS